MTHPTDDFVDLQAALAGEYSLERELGRGGMGIVYLARDVQLDRDVAIKVLPAHLAQVRESRERFVREARTAAALSHPHIVPIHRVGEAGGFVFFVMSYVEGETLGERLRTRGPLPPADATRVLREVAWALAYAHGSTEGRGCFPPFQSSSRTFSAAPASSRSASSPLTRASWRYQSG